MLTFSGFRMEFVMDFVIIRTFVRIIISAKLKFLLWKCEIWELLLVLVEVICNSFILYSTGIINFVRFA